MTVSKKDSILKKRPLGRAAAIGLTRERIVEEAIALIDDEGLTGFSVRALARRLQVYPTALYWHVGGAKADLFERRRAIYSSSSISAAVAVTKPSSCALAMTPSAPISAASTRIAAEDRPVAISHSPGTVKTAASR